MAETEAGEGAREVAADAEAAAEGVGLLLALQEIDSRADAVSYRREHHPAVAALADAKRRLAELAQAVRPDWEAREAARTERDRLEGEVAEVGRHIESVRGKLFGGTVGNPRELQALQADLDAAQVRQSQLEDAELAVMEEIERLDGVIATAEAARNEIRQAGQAATQELTAVEGQGAAELAELATSRARVVDVIAADLLRTYEQVRTRLGGVAVARLERGQCGGCHLSIPAAEVARIRRELASAALCEQCGRILIP